MRTCTWVVAVVASSWLVSTAPGAEPNTPAPKRVDIRCPVPGTSVVRSVVKDGTKVKKGDLLITLDDSNLRADAERLRIEVATAIAETIAAKTGLQRAECEGNKVSMAELALKVAVLRRQSHSAQLDMEEKMIEGEIVLAQKSFELVKRHVESIVTNTGADSVKAATAELELLKAKAALETAMNKKRLLEIMRPLKMAELEFALVEAELNLSMMKRTTAKELEVAKASLAAREQVLRVEQDRLERIEELLVQCAVLAPSDGTVRYVEKRRLAEGVLVRERQPLLVLIGE